MSVQSFDHGIDYYTATFTIQFHDGRTAKVSYGVWTKEKNPRSYIKTVFNYQSKVDIFMRDGGKVQQGGAYGRSAGFPSPNNDACSWLVWQRDKARYVSAEIQRITISQTVPDSKVEYQG